METVDDEFFDILVPFIKRALIVEKKYRDDPAYLKQILGAFAIDTRDDFAAGYISGVIEVIRCLRDPDEELN